MSDDYKNKDHDGAYLYRDPVERFGQLPETTRKWLENLREEDIKELKDSISFYHATKSGGQFVKWLMITIISVFVGAAAFGDAVQKLWHFVNRTG